MGNYSWIDILRYEARKHRMCAENRLALAADGITKEQAIELYKKTIDWALEENYPALDVLRREFSDFEHLGIYVDKHFGGDMLLQQVVVLHHCSGTINVDLDVKNAVIPMIYVANGCDITIKRPADRVFGLPIRVPIYIFGDDSSVKAVDGENVHFLINHFDTK